MPARYIEQLFHNLNEKEQKSIAYYFNREATSDGLVLRNYIESAIDNSGTRSQNKHNRMLRSRAFDKLTDILVSDYHIHHKGNFAPHDQVLLRLKKKMLLVRILSKSLNQDKLSSFKTVLNSIVSEAIKNEIYEVLVEALILKKYAFALKQGPKEVQSIEKQIEYYELCQAKVYYAGDCYYKIVTNNNLLKIKNDKLFHNYILRAIRNIKADYLKFKSQQINYYLHYILMFYYELNKKYGLSVKYCEILHSIVKSSPIIYREDRLGNALINLSQYKTFTENYNEAIKYAREAQKHYIENSNNYLATKEIEFTINFYSKKYDKARECMTKLQTHKIIDSGHFTYSKYIYYNSSLLLVQKKFKQSYDLLKKSLEIEKDKSNWNISLRITNIILCIELTKIDEASRLIESLRKHVQRHKKTADIRPRDLIVLKTLREIEKLGFNFSNKNKTIAKYIKDLSQKGKPTSWEHYSPELMPFHEWLESK